MKRIRNNAPAGHKLVIGERVIFGQTEDDVTESQAEELLTAPYADVSLVEGELKDRTREELNELAAQAGVSDPESLPNKDAVITAIEEPEVPTDEGHPAE